jgi:hypothetical protein
MAISTRLKIATRTALHIARIQILLGIDLITLK